MSLDPIKKAEKNLRKSLRDRAAAVQRAQNAESRVKVLEATLTDVWRWTNDGHPHLELLLPILQRGDRDVELTALLDSIEIGGKS